MVPAAYLDHAAGTDLRPEARAAWLEAAAVGANPSSLHARGRDARRIVEESRERVAAALGVLPTAVVFTAGGTASDNLAIAGRPPGGALVLPRTEHKAVLEPAQARAGDRIIWWECDHEGRVDPGRLAEILTDAESRGDGVELVCLMAVNNETGVRQPLAEAAAICAEHRVALHTDAVQGLGTVALDLNDVTTAAFSAHKVGGPQGVGILTVAPGADLTPLVRGGGHEGGLRAGTPDVAGIAGAAVAVDLAVAERDRHAAHLARLRDRLLRGLAVDPELDHRLNSPADGVPGIVNVSFPGCESDALMLLLDAAGVAVSTGSACTVGIPRPSHVLLAMGRDAVEARSALRISFGRTSTEADVDLLLAALPDAVARARRAGMLTRGAAS
ncbi:MAG: cysteine desulfurase family protein [Candidatus Nanopelagicales bacterium]